MTDLKNLDVLTTLGTIEVPHHVADTPPQRPTLVASWEVDPESGRPICVWRVEEGYPPVTGGRFPG